MKRLLIVLAIFHFVIIIAHNIAGIGNGLRVLHGKDQLTEEDSSVLLRLHKSIQYVPIHYYSRFSGAETGFAFFAPQVGSQYITQFLIYDAGGKLLLNLNKPELKQRESMLRYGAFLDLFQALISQVNADDHFDKRYARAILYSLSQRIGKQIPGAHRVDYSLSVYHYPSLTKTASLPQNNQHNARLLTIFENSILLEAYE